MKQASVLLSNDDSDTSDEIEMQLVGQAKFIKDSDSIHDFRQQSNSSKSKLLAVLFSTFCIICWIAQAYLIKHFQIDYNKPFLLMYVESIMYITLLPMWCCMKRYSNSRLNNNNNNNDIIVNQSTSNSLYSMTKLLVYPSIILSFIIVFEEYTWAISLNGTMISINNGIYESGVAIIYILSIIFLNMKVTFQKIFGVFICLIGVISISFVFKDNKKDNTINGMISLIISTVLNSILLVGIDYTSKKYFNKNYVSQDMIYLMILMGFSAMLFMWPFFILFHFVKIEEFELPTSEQSLFIIINGLLNLGCFTCYFLSIAFTDAMFTSIVILFILPIGYFTDVLIYKYIPSGLAYIGTIAIIIGFILIELPVFKYISKKINH